MPNTPEPVGEVIDAHFLYLNMNSDGTMCSHVAAKIRYPDGHVEERELELPAHLAPSEVQEQYRQGTIRDQ